MDTQQDGCGPTQTPDDIDIDALRQKYAHEREKRLRKEGSKQYIELEDDFSGYYEVDPYTPVTPREPIREDIDVAVLGGGFAGLLSAAHLKKAGVDDVRIIELGGDFGGVWYWNRYPGIQCDNESYCYIPLLEELDFMPSKKFADGAEIYQHCRNIGKHFGLYDSAIFSTQVHDLRWDEQIKRWRVSTNRGDDIRARFVVLASGPFHRPKLPGIPGIKTFGGHSFHSSRWDYDYTGGDSGGTYTNWPTSASASSAPAPRVSRSCRSWRATPSTSTCFSAPPPPSTRATTPPPTRNGSRRCDPAGNGSGNATSTPGRSRAWRRASRTWCATSGPSWGATPRPGCSPWTTPHP
ncbi:glucose inhibited division A family protein [Mycobacterium avium subsp. avium 2285 (R)]|nr:glucose inhibited division A family protein [Mycobacterium avium subsp. avium 2285 (R)]